jgi:hypothetical protein
MSDSLQLCLWIVAPMCLTIWILSYNLGHSNGRIEEMERHR